MLIVILYFLIVGVSTTYISTYLCARLHVDRHGFAIWLLAIGATVSALAVMIVQVLGYLSILSVPTICSVYGLLSVLIYCSSPGSLAISLNSFRRVKQSGLACWEQFNRYDKSIFFAFLTVVLCIVGASLFGVPWDFDSHGYRLSRIGMWLQEGSIHQSPTTDERMNYSAFHGDLLMLWLTAPFKSGYPLVTAVQGVAGLFVMVATWALARMLGMSIRTSGLSVVLLFSMNAFVGHMTTEQVDLLVAAYAVGAVCLFYGGLKLGIHPLFGALALAIAFGTKGSMFYFAPGLLFMGLVAIAFERVDCSKVVQFVAYCVVCLLVLASPRYIENTFNYGNPFAPESDLERLQQASDSVGGFSLEKLRLNSICYAIQVFGPSSNPFGSYTVTHYISDALGTLLPDAIDEHTVSLSRSSWFKSFQAEHLTHEASLNGSTGALTFVLACIGVLIAIYRSIRYRDKTAVILLSLFAGAAVYHIFMAGLFKWSPYKFRYYLIIAPFVAILAGSIFHNIRTRFSGKCIFVLCILSILQGFHFFVTGVTSGAGMFTIGEDLNTPKVIRAQRAALESFVPSEAKLAVSLPYYARLSSFFRSEKSINTTLISSEDLSEYGSLADFFIKTDFDAIVTRSGYWKDVIGAYRGLTFNMLGEPLNRDDFEIIRKVASNEEPRAFVRSRKLILDDSIGAIQSIYQIGNVDSAVLRVRIQNFASDQFVIFDADERRLFVGPDKIVEGHTVNIDEDGILKFTMFKVGFVEGESTPLFPTIYAENFEPLFRDKLGLQVVPNSED